MVADWLRVGADEGTPGGSGTSGTEGDAGQLLSTVDVGNITVATHLEVIR